MSGPFDDAFGRRPLIAILRGLTPGDTEPILEALAGGGMCLAEIPLNSPQPYQSLKAGAGVKGIVTGAGTVLSAKDVRRAYDAGAKYIVAPNFDLDVSAAAADIGIPMIPGVMTPTEAFAALRTSVRALKLFPAEVFGMEGLKALKAVVPPDTSLIPVGGVAASTVADWRDAGAAGVGIGSALYSPGVSPEQVLLRAQSIVTAWTGK